MREIIFRGKRIHDGKWVYGYYLYSHEHKRHLIIAHDSIDMFPIDRKTLGEYSGFLDKRGNIIFEGDKIRPTMGDRTEFEIKFVAGVFVANNDNHHTLNIPLKDLTGISGSDRRIEIIGNIHENHELL